MTTNQIRPPIKQDVRKYERERLSFVNSYRANQAMFSPIESARVVIAVRRNATMIVGLLYFMCAFVGVRTPVAWGKVAPRIV